MVRMTVGLGHGQDQPLHLAEAAEFQNIAGITAGLRQRGGMIAGIVAMLGDQRDGGFGQRTVDNIGKRLVGLCRDMKHRGGDSPTPHAARLALLVNPPLPINNPPLVLAGRAWQGPGMTEPKPSRAPLAGGFLIALSSMVGAVAGGTQGQPSAGLLMGLGAGVALALAVWLRDKRR